VVAASNKMKLKLLGLPVIENLGDFSVCTRLSKSMIWKLSYCSDKYYHEYTIPKKDGTNRVISQPSKKLKALQSWILRNILSNLESSSCCKGFETGLTILDNASPHIGSTIVLSIDIDDFFPNISAQKIFSVFNTIGYNPFISSILTKICTHNNCLPQGGPCSPRLSNLVCIRMDNRIQGYVGKRGIIYTRYADDMTFSDLTRFKALKALPTIEKIINDEGFKLNTEKTRVAGIARAKRVTGLIVNDKGAGIGARKFKEIRARIHHLTYSREKRNVALLNEVRGWLAFIKSVDKKRYDYAKNYVLNLQTQPFHKNKLIQELHLK
jgi:RNA-directed DNA polymerase